MGNLTEFHRPLLAGIRIKSSAHDEYGTLTGLATRYEDKGKLVTKGTSDRSYITFHL